MATHDAFESGPPSEYVVRGGLAGLAAGIVVGLLRTLHDLAAPVLLREAAGMALWPGVLLWCVLWGGLACLVGWLICHFPQIGGSGIPHVESVLRGTSLLRWWPTLCSKFAGTLPVLCGGLSVGREGPCIQLGATAAWGMARLWGQHTEPEHDRSPLAAGAAAGLSAAFGAPLAGVMLIFEEMRQPRTMPLIVQCLAASYTAWAVCRFGFGLPQVLPYDGFSGLLWHASWGDRARLLTALLVLGLMAGVSGALYNRCLLALKNVFVRLPVPEWSKPLGGFLPAALLFFVCPLLLGGGEEIMIGLLEPARLAAKVGWAGDAGGFAALSLTLALLLCAKFVFSLCSFTCGVPGGLLMPLLCLGALLGSLTGQGGLTLEVLQDVQAREFLIFGMAGAFAGIVRAPLTGVLLCVEMSGAWACLPGLLLVAGVAQITAQALGSEPVYVSLGKRFKPLRSADNQPFSTLK